MGATDEFVRSSLPDNAARCGKTQRRLHERLEDLQWLIDTESAINAKIAATLTGRLQHR
jgi:hypothetical protein